jgi:SAM-dependent methyltransferase
MNCPGCGSVETYFSTECPTRPIEAQNTGLTSFVYLACANCGLVFQKNHLPADYYKADYRRNLPAASEFVTEGNVRGEYKRAVGVDKFLTFWGVVSNTVLDVGSSTGELLRHMQRKYGSWVEGIEVSDAFREYANEEGIKTLASLEEETGVYGLVTVVHVLEHQEKPMEFLAEIEKHVGQYLYIEVPFLQPFLPHALMFTLDSLVGLMERAGFKVLHKEHGEDNNLRVLCAPS